MIERHVVKCRDVWPEGSKFSSRTSERDDGAPSPQRDTPYRTDISSASNINRTVFDHDVGTDEGWDCCEIGAEYKTKYGSALRIDGDLPGISCGLDEALDFAAVRQAAALYSKSRLLDWNTVAKY